MKQFKNSCLLIISLLVLIILLLVYYIKEDLNMKNINLNIVPTDISELKDNSVWCPTFQLIWNDLKNKVVGQDIEFVNDISNKEVMNLNKESFKAEDISDSYYYKNYGYMTLSFKEEIEKDILLKFNEKSDILDKFDFSEDNRDYFFYSMLVRNFTFKYPFDILNNETFGIKSDSSSNLDSNVKVLFYDDYNNYAVKLLTTNNDEVILYKGDRLSNFSDTYNLVVDKTVEDSFLETDTLTISNLNFKTENNYENLTNKSFYDINGVSYKISDAIQTIMFRLDNTGGKVKSEAGMGVKFTSLHLENRHFDFRDDFVLFLKEENKDKPYLALNITNIEEFIN